MILQATDPLMLKLLADVGTPVLTALGAIYFYHKFIAPKPNGKENKELLFRLDLALTEHFDQLRRDLETKIEKTMENRLTAYLFRQELDRPRKDSR